MLFQKLMFYFAHAADLSLLSFSMTFFKGDCGDLWHHYFTGFIFSYVSFLCLFLNCFFSSRLIRKADTPLPSLTQTFSV